jgi:leader peptidase (prepilin peptidase)/N-methyltransferase
MMQTMEPILAFLETPICLYITTGLLGALIGSFLNVVIYRLPIILEREWLMQCAEFLVSLKAKLNKPSIHCEITEQNIDIKITPRTAPPERPMFNLMWPPSHCPECKKQIHFWQNIPIVSYLLLRGYCHFCRTKIPARYAGIELLTALASVLVAVYTGPSIQLLPSLVFTWMLIAVTFIDIDEQMLPDDITLLGLWVGLLISTQHVFVSPVEAILGAAAGYLTLWLIYWVFKLCTGKEGMGYGDFKLLACVGAWLGFKVLPLVILIASLTGCIYGLSCMALHLQDKNKPIPFGPFIALGAWLSFMWGEPIIRIYLGWIH